MADIGRVFVAASNVDTVLHTQRSCGPTRYQRSCLDALVVLAAASWRDVINLFLSTWRLSCLQGSTYHVAGCLGLLGIIVMVLGRCLVLSYLDLQVRVPSTTI